MRFTIKREEFLKGLNVAARAVSSKNAKAVLENFKIDLNDRGLFITGTDENITIKTQVPYKMGDEEIIRKITKETKYDNLIKLAIFCHNKDGLPKNIDDKTICICNIMKDVYRIEELHMVINYPYIDNRINDYPTTMVYDDFKSFKEINAKMSDNNADNILVVLSKLFGINYKISYSLILEKEYIPKIIDSLVFEDKKLEKFFKQIEVVLTNYIQKKIN